MTIDFARTLHVTQLEGDVYRGESLDLDAKRVFGGQLVAQALLAAYETVPERTCHSLHGYFVRPGDAKAPIDYEVERTRDGGSFSSRRVVASQGGRQLFNMTASFQGQETGREHQAPMADVPGPEGRVHDFRLPDDDDPPAKPWPIEMRFLDVRSGEPPAAKLEPLQRAWFRLRTPHEAGPRWHQAALAFTSDMGLLEVCTRPHGVVWQMPGLLTATTEHGMWFHKPTDLNAWHLYEQDSPSATGARGFNRGTIHRADGTLIASCVQEGLFRMAPAD